jgi:hypothetical protein
MGDQQSASRAPTIGEITVQVLQFLMVTLRRQYEAMLFEEPDVPKHGHNKPQCHIPVVQPVETLLRQRVTYASPSPALFHNKTIQVANLPSLAYGSTADDFRLANGNKVFGYDGIGSRWSPRTRLKFFDGIVVASGGPTDRPWCRLKFVHSLETEACPI